MKWIGQYIQSLISRFRNDVYLEKVATDSADTPDSDTYLALKGGKIIRTSGTGSGGGDITNDDAWDAKGDLIVGTGDDAADILSVGANGYVLTADSNSNPHGVKWAAAAASGITVVDGSNSYTADSIEFQGDDVYVYDQGNGDILVIFSDQQIAFASNFGSMNDSTVRSTMRVSEPDMTSNSFYNFYAGTWGGQSQSCTDSDLILSTPNHFGGAQGSTIIKATLQGATTNDSEVYADLGSNQVVLALGATSTASGIAITVNAFVNDIIPAQKKAKVVVQIDPSTLSGSTTNSGNGSGSQKLRVKVEHLQADGSSFNPARSYTSNPVFYDARTSLSPVMPQTLAVVFGSPTTKYLSNIKYISGGSWVTSGTNVQAFYRDTNVTSDDHVLISFNNVANSSGSSYNSDNQRYEKFCEITSFSPAYSNSDDTNIVSDITWNLLNNRFGEITANAKVEKVVGGLASDTTANGNTISDVPRLFNTFTSTPTYSYEDFKTENYRLDPDTEGTWNTNQDSNGASTQTTTTLQNECVGGGEDLSNGRGDHLVQWRDGGNFTLLHPQDVPTLPSEPAQDRWTGTLAATTKKCSYYRWFRTTSSTSSANLRIHGFNRDNYNGEYTTNNTIDIWVSRPGIDNTWVPLNPAQGFNNTNDSCWNDSNDITNTSIPSYISEGLDVYNLSFSTASQDWCVRIEFNANFAYDITGLTFGQGNV